MINLEKLEELFSLAKKVGLMTFTPEPKVSVIDHVLLLSEEKREFMRQELFSYIETYKNIKQSIIDTEEEIFDISEETDQISKNLSELMLQANDEIQREIENKLKHTSWGKYKDEIEKLKQIVQNKQKLSAELSNKLKEEKEIFLQLNHKCQVAIKIQTLCDKCHQE